VTALNATVQLETSPAYYSLGIRDNGAA